MAVSRSIILALLVALTVVAYAKTPNLPAIGQTPAALSADAWVKGNPVEKFQPGTVQA